MAFEHFLMTALALAIVCCLPVESARDQYENGQEKPHVSQLLSEATDSILPERQTLIDKEINSEAHNLSDKEKSEIDRKKRGFSRLNGQRTHLSGYESFTMWKPPVYQLSRPYFIPIYGAPGRIPIYFPPQSININPGTPIHNPLPNRPYTGPNYLPPSKTTPSTTTEKESTMPVRNRFGEEEDRPIWNNDLSPPIAQSPANIIPTRPPRPPGMNEFPPLVHDVQNSGTNFLSVNSDSQSSEETVISPPNSIGMRPSRPSTTTAPRPNSSTTLRPSTAAPAATGPSNCVWAIVSCCSASSTVVPDSCFEQRGCPGPFWGSSPCDSDFARAAIAAALNYYNQ